VILEMDEETYRLVSKLLSQLTVVVGQLVKLDGAMTADGIMELDSPGGGLALVGVQRCQVNSGGRSVCHGSQARLRWNGSRREES
jgi:hypothetical protein